jgi:hypothetical protein
VTRRRGKQIVVIGGIALIAAALIVIEILRSGPAALPLRSADTPIGVVQRYLAGLASQNGSAVCATFSPALRDYIVRPGPPARGADCASIVAATHFSDGDPGIDVTDIRLVGVRSVTTDQHGNIAAKVVLWYDYPCASDMGISCDRHFDDNRDIFFLRRINGRPMIVTPGEIYNALNGSDSSPIPVSPPL